MAKYLVTSSSYFEPFTYEQLNAPIHEMAEIQRASQDAYDKIGTEAEALRRYIEREPNNSEARAMYDSYMEKLANLQNNLWSNGYNAQTRRDLSVARAGYASDISRLGAAIQSRQQRSDEYWKTRHDHPDMIMSDDPGSYSLDSYLRDDNFGKDYYSYSGNQFAQEVASDLQARAQQLIGNPEFMDMNVPGYIFLKTNNGFTNQQINDANDAVHAYWQGMGDSAFNELDPVTRIAAETINQHLVSSGASSRVSANEFERLIGFGKYGSSQAIGQPKVEHIEDKQWNYGMQDWLDQRKTSRDYGIWYQKQLVEHPEWFDSEGNRVVQQQSTNVETNATPRQYHYNESVETQERLASLRSMFGDISEDNPLFIKSEDAKGGEVQATNWVDAYYAIYGNEAAEYIRKHFNMDVNIEPTRGQQQRSRIAGKVNGQEVVIDIMTDKLSAKERSRYGLSKHDVAIRELDSNGNPTKLNVELTKKYNAARKRNNSYIDEIIEMNKEHGLGKVSSERFTNFKKKHGIDMKVPAKYVESAVRLRNVFGTLEMPTLVAAGDEKREEKAARELLGSARANSLKAGSPFAIYKIKNDGTIDYKHPVTDIGKVLTLNDDGGIKNTTGGLHKIEAAPTDIVTGREQDSIGKLRVTTDQGTFLVDPRMFNSVVANNTALQIIAGLPELMLPFTDPDKIFTESYSKSRERLSDVMYDLGLGEPMSNRTMADIMNDEQASMEYYDMLNNFIQTAFDRIGGE